MLESRQNSTYRIEDHMKTITRDLLHQLWVQCSRSSVLLDEDKIATGELSSAGYENWALRVHSASRSSCFVLICVLKIIFVPFSSNMLHIGKWCISRLARMSKT
jgi:hypothetical protein